MVVNLIAFLPGVLHHCAVGCVMFIQNKYLWKKAINFVVVLIIATLTLSPAAKATITPAHLAQLQFVDAQNRSYNLQQYLGQPILLHLWATWCAPCVREIPLLVQLQHDYAPYGLVLLPVSQDFAVDDVLHFYRVNGITNLPLLLDRESRILKAIGTKGLPISILIDRYGNELYRFAGNTNWNSPQIRAILNQLLTR